MKFAETAQTLLSLWAIGLILLGSARLKKSLRCRAAR